MVMSSSKREKKKEKEKEKKRICSLYAFSPKTSPLVLL
jgi:hypothetical protein